MGGSIEGASFTVYRTTSSAGQHRQNRSVESMRKVIKVAEDLGVASAVEAIGRRLMCLSYIIASCQRFRKAP